MSHMRMKTLAWLALLAGIYFVGDRLGAAALDAVIARSGLRFSQLYAGQFDAQVVCIGSSRGVHGFPAVIMQELSGKRVANISYNGLSPRVAEPLLADYFDRCGVPEVVLIEASFVGVETDVTGVMKFSPYFGRSQRLYKLACNMDPKCAVISNLSQLYRYNSELIPVALNYLRRSDQGGLVRRSVPDTLAAETEAMDPIELPLYEQEVAALARMVQLGRENGATVHVVLVGYLPAYRAKLANFDTWKQQIAAGIDAPVIDLTTAIDDDDAYFDRLHFNAAGSERSAALLIERGLLGSAE